MYLLTPGETSQTATLASFDPSTSSLTQLGELVCPGGRSEIPVPTIAIDHAGLIYVAYGDCGDEWLFRVDPMTMECAPTPYKRNIDGNYKDCLESMAFVPDPASPTGETLFFLASGLEVAPAPGGLPYYLGAVDTATSAARVIGPLRGPSQAAASTAIPLGGDAQGNLWAAYNAYPNSGLGTDFGMVDVQSATLSFKWQTTEAPTSTETDWRRMFGLRQGDFYLFDHQPTPPSGEVVRFRPSDGSVVTVTQTGSLEILAAASSSCR